MVRATPSMILSSNPSPVPDTVAAEVFLGDSVCEHEAYTDDLAVIHGPDEGAVTLKIGAATIVVHSAEQLLERLSRQKHVTLSLVSGLVVLASFSPF